MNMVLISVLIGLILPSAPPMQESTGARRDRLSKKLEEIRGRAFQKPLVVREGSRKEYARLSLENAKRLYGDDLDAAEIFLKTFGLIPGGIRLSVAITAQAPVGIKVYYKDGAIAIVDPDTPDDVLLGKMAAGLLDQHWPRKPRQKAIEGNFDAQVALSAARIGDEDLVKNMFWKGKKRDEKMPGGFLEGLIRATEKWEKEESGFKSMIVPRIFIRFSGFGYRRGTIFAESIRQKDGWAGMDRVQKKPPISTEQILHPEKYWKGELPVQIGTEPLFTFLEKKGYRRVYATTLGEFGTAVFFETHDKSQNSARLSAGWGGDTAAVFERKGSRLHLWLTTWDTAKDAAEFQKALLRISNRQLPKERHLTSVVIRRGTACVWLARYPMSIQNGLLDGVWNCTRNGNKPYGD